MLARLQAAFDYAGARARQGATPATIIAELVEHHRGRFIPGAQTNALRVAGVAASCTWSKGEGLLDAWKRLASVRLMEPAGGYGHE